MLPKNKDFVFVFAQGLIYIRQRLYREIGGPLKLSHVYTTTSHHMRCTQTDNHFTATNY